MASFRRSKVNMRVPGPLERIWQDVQYAVRTMRRNLGFTVFAVLLLSFAIGANTAIFSLINTVILRLLPVREPEQLMELLSIYPGESPVDAFSWMSYEHFREKNHVFSGLIGAAPSHFEVSGKNMEPEMVDGRYVTGNFFDVLGVKPAIGRLIRSRDDDMGASGAAVAVLSWPYWKSSFNLDPAVLGRQIVIDQVPAVVIGVTQPDFFGLQVGLRPDIWIPSAMEARIERPSRRANGTLGLALMGRLKHGVSLEQARAEMRVLDRWRVEGLAKKSEDPQIRQLKIDVEPAGGGFSLLRNRVGKLLLLLMTAVGLLLLLACISIATMLLARGAARRHEMAMRVCLGAGRLRLMQQVLTESLLLSSAGGLCGILLAYLFSKLLVRAINSGRHAPGLPAHLEIQVQPDIYVLAFTAGIVLMTGVLFGLAPGWNASTRSPLSLLRGMGKGYGSKYGRFFGRGLVAAQVALSVVLLSIARLFVHNLSDLEHIDLGFRRDHVLLVTLDRSHGGYKPEQLSRAYWELLARFDALPGVRSATLSAPTPISGAGASRFVSVEGHQEEPEHRRYSAVSWIAPKYFKTLGTPLVAGRDFTDEDEDRSPVAIVNEAMVRRYFAGKSPLGKHITFDGHEKTYEIVGVARDAKYYNIRESTPSTIYLDAFQGRDIPSSFLLWTRIRPMAAANAVRHTVHALLPNVSVAKMTTLADQVDASIVPERLIATLSGFFGFLGAALAAAGLYGLLAYVVAWRTKEIGIRIAMGATRGVVVGMVLKDALVMAGVGLAIGVPIAYWGERLARNLIAGLPVQSAMPIVVGAAGMVAVTLLAAYVPVRRAACVEPMEALRCE